MLDGVYQIIGECVPVFHEVPSPSHQQLQTLLRKIINRILKLLMRLGYLIKDDGIAYLARTESLDRTTHRRPCKSYRASTASPCGLRARHKVPGLQYAASRSSPVTQ